jgi:hypothetical protein
MATLVAPLIAALAADGPPRDALADPAKLVKLLRSLRAGVATVEFASRWELEAAGVVLDWSRFPPRPAAGMPSREPAGGRAPQVLAALAALRRGKALPAASVTGPVAASAELSAASAPAPGAGVGASRSAAAMSPRADAASGADVRASARLAVTAARALCDAGARLVWIVEDSGWAPRDAAPLQPLVAAIRAGGALPALHLSGEADAWLEPVKRLRQALPCFDPARSPVLARELTGHPFGVLAAPGERPHALAKHAVLVAHDGELAGRVGADGLRDAVRSLRP